MRNFPIHIITRHCVLARPQHTGQHGRRQCWRRFGWRRRSRDRRTYGFEFYSAGKEAPACLESRTPLTPGLQATSILEDVLYNIIHDTVLSVHRSEKLARMQSAAVLAQTTAQQQAAETSSNNPADKNKASATLAQIEPQITVETQGAKYESGKILLKGNPFKTTSNEVLCAHCKLPRLLYPIIGKGGQVPEDLEKEYCTRHPYIQKPGHDIYGNAFGSDAPKSKKEKAIEKAAKDAASATPTSANGDMEENLSKDKDASLMKKLGDPQGKGSGYVPWHTCPNCKRSLLITRFAQHAEKCFGIGGRQSSRAAMNKLSGNGSGTPTLNGSRVGTPVPGSQDDKVDKANVTKEKKEKKSSPEKRARDNEDEDDETPRKKHKPDKLKLKLQNKALGKEGKLKSASGSASPSQPAAKRLPKPATSAGGSADPPKKEKKAENGESKLVKMERADSQTSTAGGTRESDNDDDEFEVPESPGLSEEE